MIQDEDVLSYALFEQVALKYFEWRRAQQYNLDYENSDVNLGVHTV
jgi:oxaloacetate decarboxylase alpha subunit